MLTSKSELQLRTETSFKSSMTVISTTTTVTTTLTIIIVTVLTMFSSTVVTAITVTEEKSSLNSRLPSSSSLFSLSQKKRVHRIPGYRFHDFNLTYFSKANGNFPSCLEQQDL
ncbi:hypothetical protein STEG23_031029 [Scotinomys teguina]